MGVLLVPKKTSQRPPWHLAIGWFVFARKARPEEDQPVGLVQLTPAKFILCQPAGKQALSKRSSWIDLGTARKPKHVAIGAKTTAPALKGSANKVDTRENSTGQKGGPTLETPGESDCMRETLALVQAAGALAEGGARHEARRKPAPEATSRRDHRAVEIR